jgi:ADP-heptose:LPS heptosyltransferase
LTAPEEILVIKLSALGDFVQAAGPFAAIRAHHPGARVTLLTTALYADFARASPWFDQVWIDRRPRLWQVGALQALRRQLRSHAFAMVYDLQTSDRSGWYFRLMGRPPWSGIAPGCAYPHANADRDRMHTIERQAEQLAMAGIPTTPPPDLSWIEADVARFALPSPYVLLAPGGAAHRPAKRWPASRYAALATALAARGITPVLLGTGQDADALAEIAAACPRARSLLGQTSLFDIAVLARGAAGAVGNDSGPMHLVAAAGCPSVVLFSADSDPALCGQRGRVATLRRDDLAALAVEPVLGQLDQGPAALRLSSVYDRVSDRS